MSTSNVNDYSKNYEHIKNIIDEFFDRDNIRTFIRYMTIVGASNSNNINIVEACHELDALCSELSDSNYYEQSQKVTFQSKLMIPCGLTIEAQIIDNSGAVSIIDVFSPNKYKLLQM